MYNVILISKYVIKYEHKNSRFISDLRLQKILYFIQAQFLANDSKCFDAIIEAWKIGPVVPDAFYYPTYKLGMGFDIFESNEDNKEYLNIDIISKKDKILINKICDECSKYETFELTSITRKQTPYIKAYCEYRYNIIKDEDIKKFFKEK